MPSARLAVPVLIAAFLLVGTLGVLAEEPAAEAQTVAQALKQGKVSVGLRYRYEHVSDDGPMFGGSNGSASTLRTALAYRTARIRGFDALVQFEDVSDIGLDDHHANGGAGSLSNGVMGRPLILDPDSTEVNQAFLRYGKGEKTTYTLGRQTINLGNQRYVGAVGWRQNQQAFDGLRVDTDAIPHTRLSYAYLHNVNRITGADAPLEGHLLHGEVAVAEAGKLSPYFYSLDYDELSSAGLSTTTFGLQWKGAAVGGDSWKFHYLVEWATQSDTGDNPNDVEADYARAEVAAACKVAKVRVGIERLDGQPGQGRFTTPLATGHAYNGWADRFLNTPADGLEDLYVAVEGKSGSLSYALVYHDFGAESSGDDYGSEIDASLVYASPWKQKFGIKLASFDSDGFSADAEKIWVWTGYAF